MTTRDKIRALAARAVDPAATPAEAETSARILAQLVHSHPEALSEVELPPSAFDASDALLGATVRAVVSSVGVLFGAFRPRAPRPAPAPVSVPAQRCPACDSLALSYVRIGVRPIMQCRNGHRWEPAVKVKVQKKRATPRPKPLAR